MTAVAVDPTSILEGKVYSSASACAISLTLVLFGVPTLFSVMKFLKQQCIFHFMVFHAAEHMAEKISDMFTLFSVLICMNSHKH